MIKIPQPFTSNHTTMKSTLVLLIIMAGTIVQSQPRVNWPEDTARAKEANALYKDAMLKKNYPEAITHLSWLLEHAPDFNPAIYIHGDKIYSELVRIENDPKDKQSLQNLHLSLYDKRILYFGEKERVLNRKALTAYKYWSKRARQSEPLLAIYDSIFAFEGNHLINSNLPAYMQVIRLNKNVLTMEGILYRYDLVKAIIEERGLQHKYGKIVDDILISSVTMDCDLVENRFGLSFINQETNSSAKRLVSLALAYNCKDFTAFWKALAMLNESQPNFNFTMLLASQKINQQSLQEARVFYQKALTLTNDAQKQSAIYLTLAQIRFRERRYLEARQLAKEALQLEPTSKEAHLLIGNLYLNSFDICKEGKTQAEDRAVFIAAYESFKKAGDIKLMKLAYNQFPSKVDLHWANLQEGEKFQIGCWINSTVTLVARQD